MKFVLASHNKGKLRELQSILSELGVEVVLQSELGIDLEPEETGTTFEENSLIKASAIMKASGLPTIADDSGFCVDALNGAPGVYSARYGGGVSDGEKNQMILQEMSGKSERTCRFVCALTCCFPGGDILTARGTCEGTVAFEPEGENGFGYDPIFYVPIKECTFAQLTQEEKNGLSHRGTALRQFAEKLEAYLQQ